MQTSRSGLVLKKIIEKIELPETAYISAEKRYQDLGQWLHRPDSSCKFFSPDVFSQGSFRLGTAIKPDKDEEYDLDMGCNLSRNVTKGSITQKALKELVGHELELYRHARGIKESLSEKRRCWRLDYADDMSFHMDIVPCMPEGSESKVNLKNRMIESTGLDERLASDVSNLAVSITDNTDVDYDIKSYKWRVSNPEGYARWFESRMRSATAFLNEREYSIKASIEELPYYKWKTPLQVAIQLLKRHRDTMFKSDDDSKPISIIITTLAARAYRGEGEVVDALSNILNSMDQYVNQAVPHVPNPVNPEEDFADKWYSPDHAHLHLRENFQRWLIQARANFEALCSKSDVELTVESAMKGFGVALDRNEIGSILGVPLSVAMQPKTIQVSAPRPWLAE